MKKVIPCPINEKDLCSDMLFEGLFDKALDKEILKQVSEWLKSIEESVNDNAIDDSTSLKTVCLMVNNTCTISFHYVINN